MVSGSLCLLFAVYEDVVTMGSTGRSTKRFGLRAATLPFEATAPVTMAWHEQLEAQCMPF